METKKEELRKKFEEHLKAKYPKENIDLSDVDWAFDFFWKEIESREKLITYSESQATDWKNLCDTKQAKISRLESTLEAADALIDKFGRLITSIHESVERSKAKVLLSDSDKIERLSNEVSEELKKYSYQQKAIKRNNQQSPNS